jgi:hypothetical protein
MPTTDEYLEQIARVAEPTPRSKGGLRLNVTISLYAEGHAGLDAAGATGLPMNSDAELAECVARLINKLRTRMQASA